MLYNADEMPPKRREKSAEKIGAVSFAAGVGAVNCIFLAYAGGNFRKKV